MLGLVVSGDHVDVARDAVSEALPDETDGLELAELVCDRVRATLSEIGLAEKEVQSLGNEDGFQLLLDSSIAISKLGWMLGSYLEGSEIEKVPESKPSKENASE